MRIAQDFPCGVVEIENCWIPMPDGKRLAARIWMPDTAYDEPVPVIMEYLPYRKRDGTVWRDEPMHRYFAGHGYAAVRVDLRGTGDSEGRILDEYTSQEHADGVAALEWLAAQPWCNGRAGMMGKSWGGFNSLQIAALAPPPLKAIITVCSTDDRYADDAHFMGGCLLNENLNWGSFFFTINALPPDPQVVGAGWRDLWQERLDTVRPYAAGWLAHQRRDDYWRHGSVCEDFAAIRCAVFAVGGWADGYSNAIPRLIAGLSTVRKGLIGPWGHLYPHNGKPGPAIGFLQEAVAWWDRWLREDTEATAAERNVEDPRLRIWMEHLEHGPGPHAGHWIAEPQWPPLSGETRRYRLTGERLQLTTASTHASPHDAGTDEQRVLSSVQTLGRAAGNWCSFGDQAELPGDQRPDDQHSLSFDSEPLGEPLELLGQTVAELAVAVDQPLAFLCVRLCAVAPDGTSSRLTYGLLNLCHRTSFEQPERVVPGEWLQVRVPLNDMAYRVPAGWRLRLAVSTSYWPLVWPSPRPVTLKLRPASSHLTLPLRAAQSDDARLPPFAPPESAPPAESEDLHPEQFQRTSRFDPDTKVLTTEARLNVLPDGSPTLSRLNAIDLEVGHGIIERWTIHPQDPLSARAEAIHVATLRREGWEIEVTTTTRFWSTEGEFHLQAELRAVENGTCVAHRSWDERVAREFV